MTAAAILAALLLVPALAAVLAAGAGCVGPQAPRWVASAGLLLELGLVAALVPLAAAGTDGPWLARLELPWIPQLGIALLLAVDGLSLLLVALTALLGLVAIVGARDAVDARSGLFHCCLMACLTGAVGVFLALDLFLLLLCWQAMLIPLFLLLRVWGCGDRVGAALRLFLFPGTGGLLLLVAIVGLALTHQAHTGAPSFNYLALRATPLGETTALLLMLAFFLGCALRLPVVPFHAWLPHVQAAAPTGVGIVVAGVLLTTGGYGMLRFLWPLFPEAVARFAPVGLALGVIGVLYGTALACAQPEPRRRLAYLGLAQMGLVVLGVFAGNALALQGVVMQLLAYALCTAALLLIVGDSQAHPAGSSAPRRQGLTLLFVLGLLGLPGLAGFMGLVPILLGVYQISVTASVLAAVAWIPAAPAALGLLRDRDGAPAVAAHAARADAGRLLMLGLLAAAMLWLGLRPDTVFAQVAPALARIIEALAQGTVS